MPLELYTHLLFWKAEGNDIAFRVGGFYVISGGHQQHTVSYSWTPILIGAPRLNSHFLYQFRYQTPLRFPKL